MDEEETVLENLELLSPEGRLRIAARALREANRIAERTAGENAKLARHARNAAIAAAIASGASAIAAFIGLFV